MMKLRLAKPSHLIDINDLSELDYIREQNGEIRIGALTRHVDPERSDLLARQFPVFREAETVIADPVVRNRGTIGGSLCQADVAEDLSAVCSATKAKVVIRGTDGERVVDMADFHVGPFTTAVGAGEMLTEIRLPLRPGAGSAHEKLRADAPATGRSPRHRRRVGERRSGERRRHRARRGRPDDDPYHLRRGADPWQAAVGRAVRGSGRNRLGGLFSTPDGRGPVDYKRHLAGVLTKRALSRSVARATNREA